ncbi:LON peptidase N-terminal domain and RING finger protein 3-like [Patiria miniata]|uniref:LON peptidase N-terminal domain and RING finger protein 3 n=1 Tax=Patiria miniata TaxID=46514 RepID=A0A914AHS5_PATMI|nr:LON peptidase N-terminal domain and RING finger protein 3-like [Patiria miniata]XP_038063086.1 LON peptidase N-terminal domain and RING finger protein 3-like [Patiria miniata]
MDLAKQAFGCNNNEQATEIFDHLLHMHGPNMDWLIGRGDTYARRGNMNEALGDYMHAFRLGEVAPERLRELVNALVASVAKKGDLAESIQKFRRKLKGQPSDLFSCPACEALLYEPTTLPCGHTTCRDCLLHAAESRTCAKCKVKHPRPPAGGPRVNFKLVELLEKYFPEEMKARQLRAEGNKFYAKGKLQEAVKKYTEATKLVPHDHYVLSNRSHVNMGLKQYEEALEDAEAVCELRPDWSKGYYRKGMALTGLQQQEEAMVAFLQSLALDPFSTSSRKCLEEVLHDLLSPVQPATIKCLELQRGFPRPLRPGAASAAAAGSGGMFARGISDLAEEVALGLKAVNQLLADKDAEENEETSSDGENKEGAETASKSDKEVKRSSEDAPTASAKATPTLEAGTTKVSTPTSEATSTSEARPTSEASPTLETTTTAKPPSASETTSTPGSTPASEDTPTLGTSEATPTLEAVTRAGSNPPSEATPTSESAPTSEAEPASETTPTMKAAPTPRATPAPESPPPRKAQATECLRSRGEMSTSEFLTMRKRKRCMSSSSDAILSPTRRVEFKFARVDLIRKARTVPREKVDKEDYECSLCYRLFLEPLTTPCGHTFCKLCLNRSLDYNNSCPLCKDSLAEYLAQRNNSVSEVVLFLLQEYLGEEYREREEQHKREMEAMARFVQDQSQCEVPIFVCTLAFPTIPCPLHIFEPRYRLMVRQTMDSGARQFGMCLPDDTNQGHEDIGCMLEIQQVENLPDGRSVIKTVGGRRFKVLSRGMRDGYNTSMVEFIKDVEVTGDDIAVVRALETEVYQQAQTWFNSLPIMHQTRIIAHFGPTPAREEDPLACPQGPSWTWWLLAILPFNKRIQLGILAMPSLKDRLNALQRCLARISGYQF